jgi:hypothetical protein
MQAAHGRDQQYNMSMNGAAIPVEQIIHTVRPVDYSKI